MRKGFYVADLKIDTAEVTLVPEASYLADLSEARGKRFGQGSGTN